MVLPALVAAALLAGCGDGDDEPAAESPSSSPSTSAPATTSGPAATSTPPTDGDGTRPAPPFPANIEPDTGQASGDPVTVTGIRVGRHDGFDRVVFDVAGPGTPGWDVRYVPEASSQGSGEPIAVAGDAVLQVTISGVGYPTETGIEEYGGAMVPGSGTEVVTEVVWDTTFEGTSVAFIGTSAEQPFRVFLLEGPTRVVVDVVHG